jgi:hypothetical protein
MHGPGEPDKRNETDKEIAADLVKATLDDVERAIGLFHETRGRLVLKILHDTFPTVPFEDLVDIYRKGLKVLKKYALNGKFKQQENGMGALALMLQIVSLDTIDFLRAAGRRHERELEYASRFKASRFDNSHKLGEAFIKVNEFIDTDLKELEQVAVREYVELLRGQHCFESDGPPEKLLPAKVREVLKQPDLADKDIWAAHKSGMAKLREFLTGGMR